MDKVKFDCTGCNGPAYACSEPRDQSGWYVRAEVAEALESERDSYKALAGELAEAGKLMRDRLGLKMGTAAAEFNKTLAKYDSAIKEKKA